MEKDELAEEMLTKASELPPKLEMECVIDEERKIQLDKDQMEKLDLESEDLVRVIVEKIPLQTFFNGSRKTHLR